MLNEWELTLSAPAAVLYKDDIAFPHRVFRGTTKLHHNNVIRSFRQASGIYDAGMTDFDDVTFIATRGLRESLANAR
jgi:hypothetical protein